MESRLNLAINWFIFAVLTPLLPLWVYTTMSYLNQKPISLAQLLSSGALLYYAATLSAQVLFHRRNAARFSESKGTPAYGDMISESILPSIVIMLCVIAYIITRLSADDLTVPMISLQVGAVVASAFVSLGHSLEVNTLLSSVGRKIT